MIHVELHITYYVTVFGEKGSCIQFFKAIFSLCLSQQVTICSNKNLVIWWKDCSKNFRAFCCSRVGQWLQLNHMYMQVELHSCKIKFDETRPFVQNWYAYVCTYCSLKQTHCNIITSLWVDTASIWKTWVVATCPFMGKNVSKPVKQLNMYKHIKTQSHAAAKKLCYFNF